ncbi:MAG: pilus assembly protein PilM [Actinomycetota bacterium]|nr:pilus assembly protein PilM [Actinomycetota bacterium]
MMERFRGGSIGMDVDRAAIKAVQVSKAADGFILQHVGYHRLPEGAIIEGEVADSEMLAREMKEFWDLHSFRGKSVILGVAGRNVIVRFVDFPRLSPEDLDSAMNFQAEEHVPMPIGDAVLDHIVLGPSAENPDEDRVLLVAAHRAMISGYTAAARSGGLRPTGIDVKALALMRSALPDALFDNEETVLLLDIGTEISNLVIVQNRMPTLTQFIPLGFRDFSQAVAEAANIEADEADRQALNPNANIGSFLHDTDDENRIQPSSEAETLALDPYDPKNEGYGDGESGEGYTGDEAIELEPRSIRGDEEGSRGTSEPFDDGSEKSGPERTSGGREGHGDAMSDEGASSGERGVGSGRSFGGGVSGGRASGGDDLSEEDDGAGSESAGAESEKEGGSSGGNEEATESISGERAGGGYGESEEDGGTVEGGEVAESDSGESGFGGVNSETGRMSEESGEDAGGSVVEGGGSVDEAKTEELSSDPALMYDVRRGLEDAAGRLAEEVQRSVEFHNSRSDAREVARIFISGEGSLVRGLDGYIEDLLGVATERARPAAKLAANRSNVSDEQLGAMESVLAISLGLAMEDE